MKRAVFVSRTQDQFAPVGQMLSRKHVEVEQIGTGKDLLALLSNTPSPVDLVILSSTLEDMKARPLVEEVVAKSPFTQCVVAGDMEDKAFHDFFEGYGVMMQIGEAPSPEDVAKLEASIDKLMQLGGL